MRRAPAVIAATAAGLALVLGYHPHGGALPGATAQAPAASAPAPAGSTASSQVTVTGTDTPNQYGDVQVRVTAAGGRITQVSAMQLPNGDGRSQQISSYAGPQLAQQAVSAQSAKIDGVSGATYTSDSYRTSLQSAIDQLPSKGTTSASS
jgi:uncharacterized protein with FMN-binding domain